MIDDFQPAVLFATKQEFTKRAHTIIQRWHKLCHSNNTVLSSPLLVQDWCASGYSFHLLGSTRQSAADVGEHTKGQPSRPRVKTSYVVHK